MASLTLTRIKAVRAANDKRAQLNTNITHFKQFAKEHKIAVMESRTAIQPIVLGCADHTLKAANKLKKQGIWLSAIRPPTVAHNTSRLRVTLTAAHTQHDITHLIKHLVGAIA
jgi:8-amino-7-oxononanoate synthase